MEIQNLLINEFIFALIDSINFLLTNWGAIVDRTIVLQHKGTRIAILSEFVSDEKFTRLCVVSRVRGL